MPELPEVQTIVNDLNKKIIGRKITGVWFDLPSQISLCEILEGKPKIITLRQAQGNSEQSRTIKKPKASELGKQIKGLKILKIKRRGKNILIYLSQKFLLLIHQKLTGHLLVGKWEIKPLRPTSTRTNGSTTPAAVDHLRSRRGDSDAIGNQARHASESFFTKQAEGVLVKSLLKGPLEEKVNNYIHLIFYLDNGEQLALSDLRKFAKVLFGPKEEIENLPELKKLGPESLDKDFTFEKFKEALRQAQGKIKQVLMNQEVIAGIGNIYSDEILWQAKIHPLRPANSLTEKELKDLWLAMRQILKKALKLRGTSISDYRDTTGKSGDYSRIRLVYQREGEPCRRCGTKIKRIKIGGRSAHYCPICQRL